MSSLWRRAPPRPWPAWAPAAALGCAALGAPAEPGSIALAAMLVPPPRVWTAPAQQLAEAVDGAERGARLETGPGRAGATAVPAIAPGVLSSPANAAGTSAEGSPETPRILWRFGSASPVSGPPAVSPAGLVYVTSVEGFVHALDADGELRWSYGLSGVPLGAPIVDASDQVYVATTAPRLYALRADGHLTWMLRPRTRLAGAPVWAAPGLLYFYGRDQNLYSVPTWGSQPRGRYLGQVASVALGSLGGGLIALGTAAPEAQIYRRSALVARLALDDVAVQPLLGGQERWFAPTRAGIAAYDGATHARLWSAPGQYAAVSADEKTLVVASGRELVWLSPETGEERQRLPLPDDVSAPPVLTNIGIALVPLVSGDLLVLDAATRRRVSVRVAPAPVWSPVWSERSQRVTAAAGGAVIALDLSAWLRRGNEAGAPPSGARGAQVRPSAVRVLAARPSPGGEGA
jgi:hypothetical protein